MTSDTYIALGTCARRRIEHEWSCSSAERAILQFITDLSFDLGQTWAFVPCLADFAAVLDIHKSTVSRALRSALKKGYLLVLKRREETLYSICTETRGNAAPADAGRAQEVRARLVALNQTRLQGQSDPDGQGRIPGVLPSEETAAPARAFAAMLEAPPTSEENVPRGTNETPPTRAIAGDGEEETDAEFHSRLEGLVRAAEARREREAEPVPKTAADASNLDREMIKLCRGLNDGTKHVMERLREEFASAGKLQEAAFFKWGPVWKQRARQYPRQCLEVAGEHKNLRLTVGPAKEPGGWMYRALQEMTSASSA